MLKAILCIGFGCLAAWGALSGEGKVFFGSTIATAVFFFSDGWNPFND